MKIYTEELRENQDDEKEMNGFNKGLLERGKIGSIHRYQDEPEGKENLYQRLIQDRFAKEVRMDGR